MSSSEPTSSLTGRLRRFGFTPGVAALCLLWLAAFGPMVQPLFHAGAPRMALTDALVSKRTIQIDGYLVGYDYSEHDGHKYSDKAVGQELLAVPLYVAARAVGAEPASDVRIEENLTLWWVTLWSAGLPFLGLVTMVAAASRRRGPPVPLVALAGLMFGTMLLPFSVTLYGHLLGTALGFGAWSVLDGDDKPNGRAWIGGLLGGLAVLVEYQMAIVVVVLGVALLLRRNWGAVARFVAAGVPFLAVLLGYHAVAFGSPFRSGYQNKRVHSGATVFITGLPDPSTAWAMLMGHKGLLLFTPIVAVGMAGLVVRWRRRREESVGIAMAVTVGFLLLQAGWPNPWGGETPGPRYVIPALPFLALGLAEVWGSVPQLARKVVLGVSLTAMVLPSITEHLIGGDGWLIFDNASQLLHNGPEATLFTMAMGPAGWVVHLALAGLALRHVVRVAAREPGTT